MKAFSASSFDRSTGGGERARTDDPQLAKLVLSLLSYTPQEAFGFTFSPRLSANGR
jgi:hypothetical protein